MSAIDTSPVNVPVEPAIVPTLIFGVPVNPPAVPDVLPVTFPVNAPTKVVAVVTPVANISPSLLKVIPDPTKTPALAVTIPIESTFVTSS